MRMPRTDFVSRRGVRSGILATATLLIVAAAPLTAVSDETAVTLPAGVLEVRKVIPAGDLGLESITAVEFDATSGRLHVAGEGNAGHAVGRRVNLTGTSVEKIGDTPDRHASAAAPDGSTYELTTPTSLARSDRAGSVLDAYDLADFGVDNARAVTLAPTADPTDEPEVMSLYVADGTIGLVELAASTVMVTPTDAAALLLTIDSGAWSPPSPDTSGIAYSAELGRLVVVDGEVEESVDGFSHWSGANVWEASTSGAVSATWNIRLSDGDPAISNEPVGAAVNPTNGHVFISDDGERRIWELDAAHDVVATIDTGAGDPEGLAFGAGSIWVADGVGREVWRIQPGGDGAFGTPDDVETHFDVSDWVADPEGIEYDPATGRLFVLSSRRANQAGSGILDVTADGTFVRVVDLGISQAIKPAGLAKGPSGTFFVTDRGEDFNPNPAPSDGKIFEITIPPASGSPPSPPNTTITAGPANGSTTTSTDASFSFSGTNTPTSFECKLDAGVFAACTSPKGYTGLSLGSHTFSVRAINGAGPDATPATRTWTIEAGPSHPFTDIDASPFKDDIIWLYDAGITTGCSPTLFCPTGNVLRDQMATFIDRALDLPATAIDFFDDDDGNFHEAAINRLAAAGITTGCGVRAYCPSGIVLRDQMASFLVRAFDLVPSATNFFTDDNGNFHEANINALAAAGVTNGCGGGKYCPSSPVTREQMAAFIHRAVV